VAADEPADDELVARLVAALNDAEPAVRRRAAELAARVRGGAELEPPLRKALGDDDMIAEVAAYSLGELGSEGGIELDPTTLTALEGQARHHADALCREAAVAALGALHTGLDTILHACGDKATVRRRAVLALAPFEGPSVDAALQKALTDRDWQVRQAAEDLLGVGVPDPAEPDGDTNHAD
jgi:HEAT repeat protein